MSNLSIYEKKWLDLVFEGRNQAYGAYQLRIQNPQTTVLSLILGALFFGAILGAAILSTKTPELSAVPAFNSNTVVRVQDFTPPTPILPENVIIPASSKREKEVTSKELINPVVVSTTENLDVITTNKEAAKSIESAVTGETGEGRKSSTGSGATTNSNGQSENGLVISATLDKLPEFPGGISKFLSYVGNNFREPDLSNSGLTASKAISVIVSFVIEKDGSMTDIKVLRDPGFKLGDEAIRVLKSQKTKWKPGIKDGKPVRTLYTLPISIIPQ